MRRKDIKLDPDQRRRLIELARAGSQAFGDDAAADENATSSDAALQRRLQELAGKTADQDAAPADAAGIDENWAGIRARLTAGTPEAQPPAAPDRPARAKPRSYVYLVGGSILAAAVAAFVVLGRRPTPSFSVKGAGSAAPTAVACEVEPRTAGGALAPTADGRGFVAPAGATVALAVRCSAPSYFHVRVLAGGMLVADHRDLRLAGTDKELLREGGQPLQLSPPSTGGSLTLELTATAGPTAGPDIPQDEILWSDEIRLDDRS